MRLSDSHLTRIPHGAVNSQRPSLPRTLDLDHAPEIFKTHCFPHQFGHSNSSPYIIALSLSCLLRISRWPPYESQTYILANLKQKYTQSNGRRPFGISSLVVGFDPHTKKPHLFTTDPAGTYSEWKANAIGRSSKTVREFLEKNYKDEKQNTGLYTLTGTGRIINYF